MRELFIDKYKPKTMNDLVLPKRLWNFFNEIITTTNLNSMIFNGTAGIGKTATATLLPKLLDLNVLYINASLDRNIDTIRNEVTDFVTYGSVFNDKPKCVIFDEGDYLNPTSTQLALRGFIQDYSSICRFIITCNNKSKIIDPILSRCVVIDFNPKDKEEKLEYFILLKKRIKHILNEEKIEYDDETLAYFIKKFFPDFREILLAIEVNSKSGKLELTIVDNFNEKEINNLFKFLKEKKFGEIERWMNSNVIIDYDYSTIIDILYRYGKTKVDNIPHLIKMLNEFDINSYFATNKEIHIKSLFINMMVSLKFNEKL